MSPLLLSRRGLATIAAAVLLTTGAGGVDRPARDAVATVPGQTQPQRSADDTQPPQSANSVRFAVLGDVGTGGRQQYQVGAQVTRSLDTFPFEFVILLGDNIYGSERPQDFINKFEKPYEGILSRKIPFYASLGNHDDPNQRFYKPFNMNGERYYTFRKKDAQFFALDSNYMDRTQQDWLEKELSSSNSRWKIAFFHHPLYSSGARHGSEVDLREIVEPMFIKHKVSVVFSGHEHFYERIRPQKGIYYFTSGSAGKLRSGNIQVGPLTAKGFDTDFSYMLVEITDDQMHFQTLSRAGRMVDSGSFVPDAVGSRSGGEPR
jgi:3',5'-cyclic AMP phosphodiesterase CpdA